MLIWAKRLQNRLKMNTSAEILTSCEQKFRPCLLRRASAIHVAHHHTPKMVLMCAIFSTPKSDEIIHN